MRHVIRVSQEQLQRMRSKRKRDLCLGLPRSEVQVIEVIGNGLVQRRQRRVDQKMVVSGRGFLDTGGRYSHFGKAEADDRSTGYVGAVGRIYEIERCVSG